MPIFKSALGLCLFAAVLASPARAQTLVAQDTVETAASDRGVFPDPGDERCDSIFLNCNSTVQANLALFTSNASDPSFTCRVGGPGRGVNTGWFSFIAQNPTATLTTGIVSGGLADDTLLAVYSGLDCGVVTQIACDDDSGDGNMSLINLSGLTIGDTYYVQLAGFNSTDVGTYSLNLDCRPAYDECAGALPLSCNSAVEVNLGICTTNPNDPIFPCALGGGPVTQGFNSAWVKFTAGHPNMRLRLLATNGAGTDNTLMNARIGTGCGDLTLFACNDDAGPSGLSGLDFTGITVGREFWVQIAAKNPADIDKYTVLLECNPDCATCPPGAVVENEICGFSANGICTNGQPLSCGGATVCGTLSPAGAGLSRDIDLYSVNVPNNRFITWCAASPQPVSIALVSFPFCDTGPTPIIYDFESMGSCQNGCVSFHVAPGTYMVGIELDGNNASCAGANTYTATLSTSLACPGDLNDDNRIDTADLTRFLGRFGQPTFSDCSGADLNGDGVVDTRDLTRFLGRFGGLCLPPPPPPGPLSASGVFGLEPVSR
ncbi:MAG: dockerin type I repeat-containing protein [Phycisphaerales bacterium]